MFVKLLLRIIKLVPKLLHQMLSLVRNQNLKRLCFGVVSNDWPTGHKYHSGKPWRGLSIAEIRVDIYNLFIDNKQVANLQYREAGTAPPSYVRLQDAPRFKLVENYLGNANEDMHSEKNEKTPQLLEKTAELSKVKEAIFEKTAELSKLEEAEICVIQKLDGRILVIDGQHRLISIYLRDGHVKNLKFLITL